MRIIRNYTGFPHEVNFSPFRPATGQPERPCRSPRHRLASSRAGVVPQKFCRTRIQRSTWASPWWGRPLPPAFELAAAAASSPLRKAAFSDGMPR